MDDPSIEPSYPPPGSPDPSYPPASYPPASYPPASYPPASYPPASYPQQQDHPQPTSTPPGGWVAPPATPVREPWLERGDLRAGATLAGVLVVVGLLAGLVWAAISPHGSGVVVSKTEVVPFGEQENWIAADGRFAIITAVIGLVAGLATWFWKSRRGPVLAAALGVGAVVGSLLTAVIGRLVSSGHSTGAINSAIRLHIVLHAHGLIAVEGVIALAAYLGGVLFAGPDDLGRPADSTFTDPSPTNSSPTNPTATNPTPGYTVPTPGY